MRFFLLSAVLWLTTSLLTAAEPAPVFTDAEWSKAQPAAVVAAPAPSPAPAVGASIASLAGGLVVVIALAVGLGWTAKRFGVQRLMARRGAHLELLESLAIAPKRQVCLIRFGDQAVLVGVSDQGFTALAQQTLTALPATGPVLPVPPAPPEPPAPVDGRFAATLAQALGRKP